MQWKSNECEWNDEIGTMKIGMQWQWRWTLCVVGGAEKQFVSAAEIDRPRKVGRYFAMHCRCLFGDLFSIEKRFLSLRRRRREAIFIFFVVKLAAEPTIWELIGKFVSAVRLWIISDNNRTPMRAVFIVIGCMQHSFGVTNILVFLFVQLHLVFVRVDDCSQK